ncbi:MAG: NAD-binding protein [Chloroflexi bacterium]|nr:NAD-binding protein [Chloroflexota bacterium]
MIGKAIHAPPANKGKTSRAAHAGPGRVVRALRAVGWKPPLAGRRWLARATRRSWQALERENAPRIAALSIVLLLVGSIAIHLVEQTGEQPSITSFGDALWYTIVTMTTVGYGDLVPTTAAGRAVGALLMLGGMSLLSVFTATIASVLVAQRIKEGWGLETIKMRNHVLVCGWNEHAERVLEGLFAAPERREQVVLVNELAEEAANEILLRYHDLDVRYVHGDPAHEAVLARANVHQARAAIVLTDTSRGSAPGSDERTTLVTLALKSLKPDLKVTAEAIDLKSETHLRRAGADDIVISGEFNGFLLSSATLAPGISQVVRQLLSRSGNELCRESIPLEFVGRTFGELFQALRSRHGFLILAIVTERKGLALDDLLTDDYSLVDLFIKQQFVEAGREYLRFEEGGIRVLLNPPDAYVIDRDDTMIGLPRGA